MLQSHKRDRNTRTVSPQQFLGSGFLTVQNSGEFSPSAYSEWKRNRSKSVLFCFISNRVGQLLVQIRKWGSCACPLTCKLLASTNGNKWSDLTFFKGQWKFGICKEELKGSVGNLGTYQVFSIKQTAFPGQKASLHLLQTYKEGKEIF